MRVIVKSIIIILTLMLLLATATALADGDYYQLSYSTDPTSIADVGGDVELTVEISHDNNSAYVMSNVAVYKGDMQIISFGSIYAGQSASRSGTLPVSASEIGGVALTLRYEEDASDPQQESFIVTFSSVAHIEPNINFTRTLSDTTGESNDAIVATYTVENIGDVHITDLVISDSAAGQIKTLPILKTGQNTQVLSDIIIGDGFTSVPQVTFYVGDKKYEISLDGIDVTSGVPQLDIQAVAAKDRASVGEIIPVTITVTNSGDIDFDAVTIHEVTLGELFALDTLAAGEAETLTYDLTATEYDSYEFYAVGDNGSEQEWVARQIVNIIVDIEIPPLEVTFDATTGTTSMTGSGIVTFDIVINNNTLDVFEDVNIYDRDGNIVEIIDQLLPGKTKFQYDLNVISSGSYYFAINITDKDGNLHNLRSKPADISIAGATDISTTPASTGPIDSTSTTMSRIGGIFDKSTIIIAMIIVLLILLVLIAQIAGRRRR